MSEIVYVLLKYASSSNGFYEENELISVHGSHARAFESAQLQTRTILANLIISLLKVKKEEFQLLIEVKKQYKTLLASTNIEEVNKVLRDTLDKTRGYPEVYEHFRNVFTVYFHSENNSYSTNQVFSFRIWEKLMETNEEIDADLLIKINQFLEDK